MNEMFSQGGKGSTGILTNKQAIARKFGVKQNEVVYFAVGVDLGGYKVIYDKTTQRAYSLPVLPVGTTAISLNEHAILVHSAGTVDLGELAVSREEYVTLPGSFTTGVTVNTKNELVVSADGKYRWDGELPKTVPAGSTPVSTGGVASPAATLGNWKEVGNDALMQLAETSGALLVKTASGKTVQEELDDRRTIESFGADIAGVTPSDQALEDGLAWSSATGNTLVITGKVRITRTVNQPVNSVVECPGLVFCTDPSGLTDGWMWDVSGSNSGGNRTRIKSLVLSSAPSTETNEYIGRSMKGLRVRTAHVQVDLCYTYGCRDGGVEFGPTGFEIFGGTISCYVRGSEAYNASAVGVKMSTTDCGIQNLVAVNYPIAAHLGSSNFADNVHVWGLPATSGNLYPDMQMLTGVHFGTATRANYIYIDTHDTAAYDTAPSGDLGVGVVFNGWENSVGTILYRIHPESKAGKLKLLRFKGQNNSIEHITIPTAGSAFDKTAPIIYDADAYKWYNLIFNSTHQKEINRFTVDVSALMPSGVTAATGVMSLEKVGRTVAVTLYYSITGVDTGVSGDFTVPLPAGLKLRTSTVNALTERTCLASHPSAAGGSDLVFIGGDSKLRVRQRNASTGQSFVLQNNNLRTGALDINIQAPIE